MQFESPIVQLTLRQLDADGSIPFGLVQAAGAPSEKVPWTPPQTLEEYRQSAKKGRLFAAYVDDDVVATFLLDHEMPCPSKLFANPEHNALCVFKLAVALPRKGIGTWCLRQIESIAIAENKDVLRLAARADQKPLEAFYLAFGFHPSGQFEVEHNGAQIPATLFEKDCVVTN